MITIWIICLVFVLCHCFIPIKKFLSDDMDRDSIFLWLAIISWPIIIFIGALWMVFDLSKLFGAYLTSRLLDLDDKD